MLREVRQQIHSDVIAPKPVPAGREGGRPGLRGLGRGVGGRCEGTVCMGCACVCEGGAQESG